MRKPFEIRAATPSSATTRTLCVHCGRPAAREALFRRDGVVMIEKYCDDCLKAENFTAIMTIYERNEKL